MKLWILLIPIIGILLWWYFKIKKTTVIAETTSSADGITSITGNNPDSIQTKIDYSAKYAELTDQAKNATLKGDYVTAANICATAASMATANGDTSKASNFMKLASDYATKASTVRDAESAAKSNTYYPATPETIQAGASYAFEIANSGLGGSCAVGKTIQVTGRDGTKTFINTGNGYAEYTPVLSRAVDIVNTTDSTTLRNKIISSGFSTAAKLDAMTEAERSVYYSTIIANNPKLLGEPARAVITGDVERSIFGTGAPKEGSARQAYERALATGDIKTAQSLDALYGYSSLV